MKASNLVSSLKVLIPRHLKTHAPGNPESTAVRAGRPNRLVGKHSFPVWKKDTKMVGRVDGAGDRMKATSVL